MMRVTTIIRVIPVLSKVPMSSKKCIFPIEEAKNLMKRSDDCMKIKFF